MSPALRSSKQLQSLNLLPLMVHASGQGVAGIDAGVKLMQGVIVARWHA